MNADLEANSLCLIVYVETVSHELKKVLSSELATTDAILLAQLNQRSIVAVELLFTKKHHAQAAVEAKSSTVTLSLTIADAQHAKVLPKAKSSMATRVLLQLL